MPKGYRIHKSDLIVLGVFLAVGGVFLLLVIDFLWGVLCIVGAFTCLYQAYSREKRIEEDRLSQLKRTG